MELTSFFADRTVRAMIGNFATIFSAVGGCGLLLTRKAESKSLGFLAATTCSCAPKKATEDFWLGWAVCWVCSFGVIIGFGMYEWFDRWHYLLVCGGLVAPLILQPILWPGLTGEAKVPWHERHSFKANVWIAIFSFIGNWWYTHYFYSVLEASYSMPGHDVNAVPIAMFLATHFYFTLYHALAAKALRAVTKLYQPGLGRSTFVCALVAAMAYSTAFTESATISAYPCYRFSDIHQAYTLGSAFYGIYFIVSYPLFFDLDEPPEGEPASAKAAPDNLSAKAKASSNLALNYSDRWVYSLRRCVLEALGAGMAVLMLLDAVRVWLEIPLAIALERPCKADPSLTCAPFTGGAC